MDFVISVIGSIMMWISVDLYRTGESKLPPLSIHRLLQLFLFFGAFIFFNVFLDIPDGQLLTKSMFFLSGTVCLLVAKDHFRKGDSIVPIFSYENLF